MKTYTFINIVGFTVGLATCILILLYVIHELNYDKLHASANLTCPQSLYYP